MISCYALLAVYLSSSGALDVSNLDSSYAKLKQEKYVYGQVKYTEKGHDFEDTFMISAKTRFLPHKILNDETTVDKCELKGKTHYGAFNHYEKLK